MTNDITRAQIEAARELVERADKTRRWVAPEIRTIAEMKVEHDESNTPPSPVVPKPATR